MQDRRQIVRVSALFVCLLLVAYSSSVFVIGAFAVSSIEKDSALNLLSRIDADAAAVPAMSRGERLLHLALRAEPFNAKVVNAAVVRRAYEAKSLTFMRHSFGSLTKLGWRDTVSLQNRIFLASKFGDVKSIADAADALMRRNVLKAEAMALMNVIELSPSGRRVVEAKLAGRPIWLGYYMAGVYSFQTEPQFSARLATVNGLLDRRLDFSLDEISPLIDCLTKKGDLPNAYAIWLRFRRARPALLNDPTFELAYASQRHNAPILPFEWKTFSGVGFSTSFIDVDGGLALEINWDKKGVPTFVSQQLVIQDRSGPLTLTVAGRPDELRDMSSLLFRLQCPGQTVAFDRVERGLEKSGSENSMELVATAGIPCRHPVVEIIGRPINASVLDTNTSRNSINPVKLQIRSLLLS